jgi:hypothetical protein
MRLLMENKDDVILAYEEAGLPLTPILIADLDQVDAELRDLGVSRRIVVMTSKCRICGNKETVIAPAVCNSDFECAECGNMSAEQYDDEDIG